MLYLREQDMIINKIDQVNNDNDWSTLPTLFIWMIKDRLDYHNGVRFALACKDWQHAFLSCPPRNEFERDNTPPWIMTYREEITDSRRSFISLLTEERFTFDNPEFSGTEVLYSKQGWLLLLRKRVNGDQSMSEDSPYFLFNPFKNKKISLPFLDIDEKLEQGAFTIKDGNPHCIVLARTEVSFWMQNRRSTISLHITYAGDTVWLRYSYLCKKGEYLRNPLFLKWVFTIRKFVYFITKEARVFIFDITNLQWKDFMTESDGPLQGEQYIVERQGELLLLHFPEGVVNMNRDFDKATCYRLKKVKNVYWELVDSRLYFPRCFWYLTKLCGHSFVFDANDESELAKLQKSFQRTLAFTIRRKSTWVHMG